MKKPRWQRILELEDQARHGSAPSPDNPPPMPSQSLQSDPLARQMAKDLRVVSQKASIEMNAQAIATAIVLGFIAIVVYNGFF